MRYIAGILILNSLSFIGSEDDYSKGNIKVTGKHFSHTIEQATVYLKSGVLINPSISLDQYEWHQRADGAGGA